MNIKELEKKSSAITLSDMEMFIFPELLYGLVLANIMSPCIWRWRDDPWFDGFEKMKPYRKINRLKQYIIEHYIFNLDLDTWGLTTKEKEMKRFCDFIDEDTLKKSNALFGYEGDKYYFDIDIRTHFGLDKYEGNIIPYWKTETVEAMDAFKYKPDYPTGAGECVSLATLYAAALFIVAGIPLKDIYLMATPLHSQNFIDIGMGVLTNNRRLITKNMWFNGTELSARSRRALENEHITIIAHETGYIHSVYNESTINADIYSLFSNHLHDYLKCSLTPEILGSFLRHDRNIQKCFQIRCPMYGFNKYIGIERVFAYEHGSSYKITNNTREKLLLEIDREEFLPSPMPSRIILNDLEAFIKNHNIDIDKKEDVTRLKQQFASDCLNAEIAIESLIRFCHVKPRLPDSSTKNFISEGEPLAINNNMTREEIIERIDSIRQKNNICNMAFYAYRDMSRCDITPFLIAAVRRNPVSVQDSAELDNEAIFKKIKKMPDVSIYDGLSRLAQPDEVWNYNHGDGIEKALLFANILRNRMPDDNLKIEVSKECAVLKTGSLKYTFPSCKKIRENIIEIPFL